jgi:6-phosphogluconolactonase
VLAAAAAARLVTRLVDVQAAGRVPRLVLTGGGVGTAVLEQLAQGPARDAVDWRRVDVWWGDERFLPTGNPERNETQARSALLESIPVDARRVHPMPASDGPEGDDVEAAAGRYAELLTAVGPRFDVLMLGIGPEGHVASLFPGRPELRDERLAVAVRDCPKPPPIRISLTVRAIQTASEVWLLAAGEEKAPAVARALKGATATEVPAAAACGSEQTLWLVDSAAASELDATRDHEGLSWS